MAASNKRFAPRGLTHSATHHLLAVDQAVTSRGYARVCDIARDLGITRGTVSVAMRSLKVAGHVLQDENRFFHLTDRGRRAVASIRARHEVVEQFLTEILGLSLEQSHRESCSIENLIEAPTARRLHALIAYWRTHGLAGVLDDQAGPPCPICGGQDDTDCSCCGLECIDGACSLTTAATVPGGN